MFTNRYQGIIYQVFLQSPKVRREVTPGKGLNTFSACIFRFERFRILHLNLLNESERYYDHKELWVIVKNFSMTHGVGFRSYRVNVP